MWQQYSAYYEAKVVRSTDLALGYKSHLRPETRPDHKAWVFLRPCQAYLAPLLDQYRTCSCRV